MLPGRKAPPFPCSMPLGSQINLVALAFAAVSVPDQCPVASDTQITAQLSLRRSA